MVFSKRAEVPVHKVVSEEDLEQALSYLHASRNSWNPDDVQSNQERLAMINRVKNMNNHFLRSAEHTNADIETFASIDEALTLDAKNVRMSLSSIEENQELDLPSFAIQAE